MKDGKHIDEFGDENWYKGGEWHRADGPSFTSAKSNTKVWRQNGKLHRLDGPAIEGILGVDYWYINGDQFTESEFLIERERLGFDEMMRELLTEAEKPV